jgi:hypothetical protein
MGSTSIDERRVVTIVSTTGRIYIKSCKDLRRRMVKAENDLNGAVRILS